jgi:hypothetical protein
MLHAADVFLRRSWNSADPLLATMPRQQATIFYDCLCSVIGERNPIVARACLFARDFESWLTDWGGVDWFAAVTYELAAFEPELGRRAKWPTDFLSRLEQELDYNRGALQARIKTVISPRDLYSILAPI